MPSRAPLAWRELRERTVLATVLCSIAFLAWAGVGVSSVIGGWDLPTLYWLPLWIGGPAYAIYELKRYVPEQDFSRQPWGERGREIVNLFRWRTMAGRQWGSWLILLGFGIPMGVIGMVTGPPYHRASSAALLVGCAAAGWVGLKCLDARIARRMRTDT